MARSFDREALPESVSDEQLVAVLESGGAQVGKVEAVKELGRRGLTSGAEVLTRVVADDQQPQDVRAAAIVELAHDDSAPARQALEVALGSGEAPVVRRAAEALGRIGDDRALANLESTPVPDGPARRSAEFAQTLVSYRLGVDGHRIAPGDVGPLLDLTSETAEPLQVQALEPEKFERALDGLRRSLPGMAAATAGALALKCGDSEYAVLLNGELQQEDALGRLQAAPAMPAVVVKLSGGLDRYYTHAYVLTHPVEEGLEVVVTRTTGDVVYAGSARIRGGSAAFELRAVASPYSQPVRLEGVFDPGAMVVHIERALVASRAESARRGMKQPRKIDT